MPPNLQLLGCEIMYVCGKNTIRVTIAIGPNDQEGTYSCTVWSRPPKTFLHAPWCCFICYSNFDCHIKQCRQHPRHDLQEEEHEICHLNFQAKESRIGMK